MYDAALTSHEVLPGLVRIGARVRRTFCAGA